MVNILRWLTKSLCNPQNSTHNKQMFVFHLLQQNFSSLKVLGSMQPTDRHISVKQKPDFFVKNKMSWYFWPRSSQLLRIHILYFLVTWKDVQWKEDTIHGREFYWSKHQNNYWCIFLFFFQGLGQRIQLVSCFCLFDFLFRYLCFIRYLWQSIFYIIK